MATKYSYELIEELSGKVQKAFNDMEANIETLKSRKDELMGEWQGMSASAYDAVIDQIKANVSNLQTHFDGLLRQIFADANAGMYENEQIGARTIDEQIGS